MSAIKKSDARLLNEAIEGITQAAGAAKQLTHARNPQWMMIAQALDLMKEGLQNVATVNLNRVTGIKR